MEVDLTNVPSVTCDNCSSSIAISLLRNHSVNCNGGTSTLEVDESPSPTNNTQDHDVANLDNEVKYTVKNIYIFNCIQYEKTAKSVLSVPSRGTELLIDM